MGASRVGVVVEQEVTKGLQTGYKTVTFREKRMTKNFTAKWLTFFVKCDIMEVRPHAGRAPAQGGMTSCPGVCQKNNF